METLQYVLLANAVIISGFMFTGWIISIIIKDAGIIDTLWGIGFLLTAWSTTFLTGGVATTKLVIVAPATLWGLRLSVYIFVRNRGRGEDARYRKMRENAGKKFPLTSLLTVFSFQGLIMFIVSLPLQTGQAGLKPSVFSWIAATGVLVWLAGFVIEATADYQLAVFKSDPGNRGRVMNRGLWGCSRHPNYFGESLVWWGLFIIALRAPYALVSVISPLLITFMLLRVSGITLLEKNLIRTKPQYDRYIRTTSAFIPWFKKQD